MANKFKPEEGQIVWDTQNKCYGVVLVAYDDNSGEVRLDSDGNQPIKNLRPMGSRGDKGTRNKLIACMNMHRRLVTEWNYSPINY